ncbi:MAG: hypothetical protein K2J73_10585 [Oscillospiraceae bacterium]|nr:hypothetical protein [Oscillospiraceae bacterium]
MAVVLEMKASNGATVRIHDDAYAGISPEEMRKRQQALIECAKRITINAELRRLREAREAKQN